MFARPVSVLAFAAFALLLSAAMADADCAWVMWAEVLTAGKIWGSTTHYAIMSGYLSQAECLVAASRPSGEAARVSPGVITKKLCLPDVDPRGPKGK